MGKRASETYSSNPPLVEQLRVKEGARQKHRSKPGLQIVFKWFAAKKATGL